MHGHWANGFGASRPAVEARFQGHRGGVIAMHRALNYFRLGPLQLLMSVSLFLFFSAIWIASLPSVCRFWSGFFRQSLLLLPLHGTLEVAEYNYHSFRLGIPYIRIYPTLPDLRIWFLTCLATGLLFISTFFLPQRWVPLIYLARTVLAVQGTSLVYFALWPMRFPHAPDSYLESLITSGIGLITVVPLFYALSYYIFDFGFWKKAVLTGLTLAHLTVFLPFQVVLQALVLQSTILFMPVLYIVFGVPVLVLLIVAFYSWGMTWPFRSARQPEARLANTANWWGKDFFLAEKPRP